jgi:hypothetical protein
MYSHERSLVQKMQGKPFALLGVNSDRDRAALKEVLKTENITWRSFWAGGTEGAIPTQWQILGWPTVFIIDHKGVIRHKFDQGFSNGYDVLDVEINKLLTEASKESS